jgi:hypothetical protein
MCDTPLVQLSMKSIISICDLGFIWIHLTTIERNMFLLGLKWATTHPCPYYHIDMPKHQIKENRGILRYLCFFQMLLHCMLSNKMGYAWVWSNGVQPSQYSSQVCVCAKLMSILVSQKDNGRFCAKLMSILVSQKDNGRFCSWEASLIWEGHI